MNNALHMQLNLDTPSRQEPSDDRSNDSNWTSRGIRKSGRYYDEVENEKEIAYFLDRRQEHDDIAE